MVASSIFRRFNRPSRGSLWIIEDFFLSAKFFFWADFCYDGPMELQVGVKILLKNREDKYLLLRRSAKKYPEAGEQWDMVGGRILPGTGLMENLSREIFEESGLRLEGEPTLVAAQDILRVPGRHVVRLTYLGMAAGEPKLSDEHDAYRWFSKEELRKIEKGDPYLGELLKKGILDREPS